MTKGVGGSTADRELWALGPRPGGAGAITADERSGRLEHARQLMADAGVEAMLVRGGASLRYFTGVAWGQSERLVALILPRRGRPIMICPAFELGTMQASLLIEAEIRTWEEDEDPCALAGRALGELGLRTLAIDPELPFVFYDGLRLGAPSLEVTSAASVVDGCRRIKSPAELALMSQAKAITLEVHRRAARMLAPGMTTGQVRSFIDEAHRRLGAPGSPKT